MEKRPEGYYGFKRPEMASFLPGEYQRVLEIGCGQGEFRGHLKPEVEVWGIEPDPNEYAEEYTKIFVGKMKALMKKMPIVGLIPKIKDFIDTTFTADAIPLALKNSMFFQKVLDAEDSIYRDRTADTINFDIIVADFPPTGNMIALFEIPEDQVKVFLKYSL